MDDAWLKVDLDMSRLWITSRTYVVEFVSGRLSLSSRAVRELLHQSPANGGLLTLTDIRRPRFGKVRTGTAQLRQVARWVLGRNVLAADQRSS
jgi:hypothetical protein